MLTKLGTKSELEAIDDSLAQEESIWAKRKANFEAELAEASKKKNSLAEVARINGQMADAERDYLQNVAKLRADAVLAEQRHADALEDRISKQQSAARAAQAQVLAAQQEGKAIGLTGDALRVFNQEQLENSIPLALKMQAAWADEAGALGDLGKAARDQIQAIRDLAKVQGETRSAQMVYDYTKGIADSNRLLQAEIGLMGMSAQARETALEQLRIQLDLEEKIAAVKANVADADKQVADIAKLQASAAIAQANAASRAFLSEWKESVQKYDDIFRQGFADMLNNGKDGWKSFTKSLATTFKTTVADQLYKAFAQPFVVNIVGNLMGLIGTAGLSAVVGAATGGSNFLGLAANGASLYSGLTSGTGMLGTVGGWLGLGSTAATTTGIGVGTSLASPGMAAMVNPVAAGGAGGLSGALSAIPGWGWALAGIALLGSIFSKKSTPHYGAGATYEGGQITHTGQSEYDQAYYGIGAPHQWQQQMQNFVSPVAQGVGSLLDGIAATFKQGGGYRVLTAFADDSSDDGAHGQLRITDASGKDLVNWEDLRTSKWAPRIFADGEEGQKEYLAAIAKDTRQVLLDMDLPSWADTLLESIGDAANMDQLSAAVQQIGVIQTLFENLGQTLVGFAGMADVAFEALLKASGGADALANSSAAFYQGFYSEGERKEITRRNLGAQLNELGYEFDFSAPDAQARYRKMVEDALAQANADEVASANLRGNLAGSIVDRGGLESLSATDLESLVRDTLGLDAVSNVDIGAITTGIAALDMAGMSTDKLTESISELLEPIVGTGKSAAETAAALLGLSGAVAGVTTSAEDAARALEDQIKAQKDAAYSLFRRALDRDRDALNDQASTLQDVISGISDAVSLLRDNARDLYGTVDSTRQMLAAQGMVYIEQALGGVRAGGSLLDYTGLGDAITAARGGIDSGRYVSQFERDRDALVLAGQLTQLGDLGDLQLSIEERQLRAVNEQLDYLAGLEKRADALVNGTSELTGTVDEYFRQLLGILAPETAEPDKPTAGSVGAGGAGGITWGAPSNTSGKYYQPIGGYTGGTMYGGVSLEQEKRLDQYAAGYHAFDGTGDAAGLNAWITENKLTPEDLSGLSGLYESDWERWFKANGIPSFDVGTNYVPRDMLARIHEGEAIVPKPFNPWAGGQQGMGGNTERLEQLVQTLTEQNARLEARLAAIESATKQQATQFASYSNGGTFSRSKALA